MRLRDCNLLGQLQLVGCSWCKLTPDLLCPEECRTALIPRDCDRKAQVIVLTWHEHLCSRAVNECVVEALCELPVCDLCSSASWTNEDLCFLLACICILYAEIKRSLSVPLFCASRRELRAAAWPG